MQHHFKVIIQVNFTFVLSCLSLMFCQPGPGFIKSIKFTTNSDSITLRLGEPREKNADEITYDAQVSFSYKILCGPGMANADHWQNKTNANSSELSFSKLQSYSVYKVRAWATTSAGAGPVLEKLAYTKPGGKYLNSLNGLGQIQIQSV